MANLKDIRNRISSVKSTQQITKAMKMVAASKLKKAQDAIINIRPYAFKLNEVISQLSEGIEDLSANPYYQKRDIEKVLLIPITGDKGLCGSFNTNVIRKTRQLVQDYESISEKHYHVDLLCIGKKAADYFKKNNYHVADTILELSNDYAYRRIDEIASKVLKQFELKDYDEVKLIFNSFKNPAVYNTKVHDFLPLESIETTEEEVTQDNIMFLFEPNEKEIIDDLIPMSLKISFFRIVLESNTAEHGARMTAMDKATENAEELITDLKLFYNKERQAAITNELIDIIGGTKGME